jgi:hypothetical protein
MIGGDVKITRIAMLVIVVLMICSIPVVSQEQIKMQDLLTAEQMKSAGLHKLTASELETLNAYIAIIVKVALENDNTSNSSGSPASSSDVIESRISGEFTGWEGETIFKLMNGQVWQQSSYAYTYHYAYMPEVTIYRVGSQYKLKVEGVSGSIYVKQIR